MSGPISRPSQTRQGIPHRLIDLVDPDESFNAGLFRQHAIEAIERLYQRPPASLGRGWHGPLCTNAPQGLVRSAAGRSDGAGTVARGGA